MLGALLFDRNKQRVHLTAAGRELLVHARAVLEQVAATKTRIADAARGTSGELRIGYTESAIHVDLLLRGLRRMRSERPQVRLSLLPMKSVLQLAALECHELDVGFVWAIPERTPSTLRFETVWNEALVAALPRDHALASESGEVALCELRDQPFVTLSRDGGTLLFRTIVRACLLSGFVPEVGREAADLASLLGMVAAGAGVALVPASMTCLRAPGLAYRRLAGSMEPLRLHWASRRDEQSPLVPLLLEALATEAGQLPTPA